MPSVEVVTVVRATPEVVFELELDADVHAASMAASGETATTTGRRELRHGDDVTFTARHCGVTWRLTSRITEYERPHRFTDEQTSGPFRHMRQEHLVETAGEAMTRMTDRLRFEARLGPLGAAVARVVLVPYLRSLLGQRAAYVKGLAER